MLPGYFESRLLLQVVPLTLAALLALALVWRRLKPAPLGAGILLLLLLAQRGLEERDYYPTYPSRVFYPPLRSLEKVPRREPWRMAAVGFTFIPNIAALYELEDVRGYEAMTFLPYFETYPLWCVHQPVWFNRVDDPTKPFLSFLNVRYFLAGRRYSRPPGWKVLFEGDEGLLLENPRVLPRAFVPRSLGYSVDGGQRVAVMRSIEDFAEHGVVGEPAPSGSPGGGWQKNGNASVSISSYLPQRMTLEIDAEEPALVATSVTAWPGWKLKVDAAPAALVPYNHAFLAFRVPPGRHTAVLRYLPDGFLVGCGVSAVTLLLCIGLSLHRRGFDRRYGDGPRKT
jgi:hypothetical protein